MSSSSNEEGIDCTTNVTVTALIHYPKVTNSFHNKFVPSNKECKKKIEPPNTDDIEKIEEIESESKSPVKLLSNNKNVKRKKQTIILKPLISTNSSVSQKESKIRRVRTAKRYRDSSIKEKESEIFNKKLREISSSSPSTLPDLDIEPESKNKPKGKSSLSSIFSSELNSKVKEKYPQRMQMASKKDNTEMNNEEIDFVLRSPAPADKSIQSVDENLLNIADAIVEKPSTPKSKTMMKKLIPAEVCINEKKQIEPPLDFEVISKKKRLTKEEIYKHERLKNEHVSFDSLEAYETLKPPNNTDLIKNSSNFVPQSWKTTGQPFPAERKKRLIELLTHHEKALKDISQMFKESKFN